jgi:hypothetical protein
MCGRSDVQIHHLDGDASNNEFENLALLCLTHHHEATVQSGIARKLSAETIRRYRNDHCGRIERRRKMQNMAAPRTVADEKFETCVQAAEVSEIRKLRAQLAFGEIAEAEPLILKLYDYWMCGDHTKVAILEALYEPASKAKDGLTCQLSFQINNIAVNTLPLRMVRARPSKRRLSTIEQKLYELSIQIGFELAYQGALYLQNLPIVKDGADLLWRALHVARQHHCKGLMTMAVQEFESAIDAAERAGFTEAQRLLTSFRNQATQPDSGYPLLDDDLEELVYSRYGSEE